MKKLLIALMICLVSSSVLSQNSTSRLLGVKLDSDWATFSTELRNKYPNFTVKVDENGNIYLDGTCTFYGNRNTRVKIYKDNKLGKIRWFEINVLYDDNIHGEAESEVKLATLFFKNDMNMNCEVKETPIQEGDRCAWEHEIIVEKGKGEVILDFCMMDDDNSYIIIYYWFNSKDSWI